jgi:hypothetical protein
MTRFVALVAVGLLALAGTAVAKTNGAKVYRAALAPVAVDATTPTGKAHLVDGKKNNILTIHVKGLTPGTSYPWHLHAVAPGVEDPCVAGAQEGPIDTSFAYGTLTGNPAGNGSAKAKSPTFNWGAATNRYYVDVHDPITGAPIACGELFGKASKPKPKTTPKSNGKQVGKAPVGKAPKSPKKVK